MPKYTYYNNDRQVHTSLEEALADEKLCYRACLENTGYWFPEVTCPRNCMVMTHWIDEEGKHHYSPNMKLCDVDGDGTSRWAKGFPLSWMFMHKAPQHHNLTK